MTGALLPGAVGVKICGISDERGVRACVDAGADWIGFVFHPASRRAVSPARARDLACGLPARIRTVGLFVGADCERIKAALEAVPLGALQLYDGRERVAAARQRFGIETWWARPIRDPAELEPIGLSADRLLVEAKAPDEGASPGGHGTRLDWNTLRRPMDGLTWMLAGGLDPTNVAHAIRASGAPSVDVSSGVEDRSGAKDPARIRDFVNAAREALAAARR